MQPRHMSTSLNRASRQYPRRKGAAQALGDVLGQQFLDAVDRVLGDVLDDVARVLLHA